MAAITVIAWLYIVLVAGRDMLSMPQDMVMPFQPWGWADFGLMLAMWAAMMVGMMLPSAAPTILVFSAFTRRQRQNGQVMAPTSAFLAGYIIVWSAFSIGATLLQWGLESAAVMSPMMVATSRLLGSGLLLAAGLYQFTAFKRSCLGHCRSPLDFVARNFRPGTGGALRMGIEHGAFCVGCCWVLMGLLFFAGVMNLVAVAAIAAFVLLEKVTPYGALIRRVSGFLFVVAGLVVLFGG